MCKCRITGKYFKAKEGIIAYDTYGDKHLYSPEVSTRECIECGNLIVTNDGNGDNYIIDQRGDVVCAECVNDYILCEECGCLTRDIDSTFVTNANNEEIRICVDCRDDEYYVCDSCGEWYHSSLVTIVDGYTYCEDCRDRELTQCECCGDWIRNNDSYTTEDDVNLCECCYDERTEYCDVCNERYYNISVHYNEEEDRYICERCEEAREGNNSTIIHNYSYKPKPNFLKTDTEKDKNNNEYFGFEIEVSKYEDSKDAENFLSILENNTVYIKQDGSVSGFEIVTHPMTRTYFYNNFKQNLERGMKYLIRQGYSGHNRAGIHIHVSKEAITEEQLSKLTMLLYPKTRKVYNLWLKITQRKENELNQWSSMSPASLCHDKKTIIKNIKDDKTKNVETRERYTAINTRNENTIEFRIFNSNMRIERIVKNAEVIFSLLDFTKTNKMPTMTNYLNFVEENSDKYRVFYEFLVEKRIKQSKEQKLKEKELLEYISKQANKEIRSIIDIREYLTSLNVTDNVTDVSSLVSLADEEERYEQCV